MRKVEMIDKKYLKAVSCFNFGEYQNYCKETIKFKENDNLDYCGLSSCEYYTSSPEIAETISNTPWEAKPFPFSMNVLKCDDGGIPRSGNIVQRIFVDGEWRRRQFANSLSTWWGEWVNIEKAINDILNNESLQKFFTEDWDRYMVIDGSSFRKKDGKKAMQ
jgi:hypothetical protein